MNITRRRFVTATALGIAAGPSYLRGVAAAGGSATFRELRRDVGIFTARGGTIGWLVNDGGAIVVDSQFADTAADCLTGLRTRGVEAIDALVNTHHHGDHTGGNAALRDATQRIVAHTRAVALQRRTAEAAGTEAAQAYADSTFDDEWSADIGRERVHARHYGAAHTGGDCTVHFERANVVHMGDLVFNRAYPFIDVAGGASVRGWVQLLERVAAAHDADTLYVFGHAREGADVVGARADILYQRDFLSAVLDVAQRAVAARQSREEATTNVTFPGFDDFAPLAARLTLEAAIGAAWDELSAAP